MEGKTRFERSGLQGRRELVEFVYAGERDIHGASTGLRMRLDNLPTRRIQRRGEYR